MASCQEGGEHATWPAVKRARGPGDMPHGQLSRGPGGGTCHMASCQEGQGGGGGDMPHGQLSKEQGGDT